MPRKPTLYTASDLGKASRQGGGRALAKMIKELRLKPVQEVITAKRTYRLFDQAAMDAVVAWRAARDQTPVANEPESPEPAGVDVSALAARLDTMQSASAEGREYFHRQVAQVHEKLGRVEALLAQILEVVTRPPETIPLGMANALASGRPDDAGH